MLKLSENNKDLGIMRVGQSKSFSVDLINDGNQIEKITSLRKGCGKCTSVSRDSDIVPPKGRTKLNIVFTPDRTGINRKTVTVNDNLVFNFNAIVQ